MSRFLLSVLLAMSVCGGSCAAAERDGIVESNLSAVTNVNSDSVSVLHKPENLPARWGCMIMAVPGKVLGLDQWAKDELQEDNTFSIAGELRYTPQPEDNSLFAQDYDYPTFSIGFRYSFNHGTELQRVGTKDNSILGDVTTLYGKFSRPFWRTRHFELAYYLGTGIGYSHKKYNMTDEVNNEFIGSIWDIYFTAGLSATYKIGREWAVLAGIDFSHHSNGALYRPNKGTNYLGPFVGVAYTPADKDEAKDDNPEPAIRPTNGYQKGLFLELSAGLGGKSLLEDWFYTQEVKTAPHYRSPKYSVYGAFSFQADVMYRYARRWASGVGVDVFYGDYASKIKKLDDIMGHSDEKHSPWSVGLALKHEAFYGRLSARMGVGFYLYRNMGYVANKYEKPQWMYERIGLFYSIPKWHNASIGFSIKAHKTKADLTELVISYPIKL